jgi:transketolase
MNKELGYVRDGYGIGLVEVADQNANVVALCADLADSTRTGWFKEKYPDRYVEIGVAEQNLAALASGMAAVGKIPFIASYAAFSPGRNYEQIRTTAALNEMPVKIVGCHAGLSVGPDGATHQMLEDIGLMRMLPNMRVFVPCDIHEARKTIHAMVQNTEKPDYIRFGRDKTPVLTSTDADFNPGQSYLMHESLDPKVLIVGAGPILANAIRAAEKLGAEGMGVNVLNSHTIKPLDTGTILKEAKKVSLVVTVEEHQMAGGLGSAVAEFLIQQDMQNYPVKMKIIGVEDRFGQSGTPEQLYKEYGLDTDSIISSIKDALA